MSATSYCEVSLQFVYQSRFCCPGCVQLYCDNGSGLWLLWAPINADYVIFSNNIGVLQHCPFIPVDNLFNLESCRVTSVFQLSQARQGAPCYDIRSLKHCPLLQSKDLVNIFGSGENHEVGNIFQLNQAESIQDKVHPLTVHYVAYWQQYQGFEILCSLSFLKDLVNTCCKSAILEVDSIFWL